MFLSLNEANVLSVREKKSVSSDFFCKQRNERNLGFYKIGSKRDLKSGPKRDLKGNLRRDLKSGLKRI